MAKQVWDWISTNYATIGWIIAILSVFIQIAPIKLNPWSRIFKWISKVLTGDACKKIDGVIEKIDTIEKNVTENEKDRIRWEILDFANSCRNGRKHTRDEFQHIITLNTKYRRLLAQTNDANGVFEVEMEYIKQIYAERLEKNDFLT